MVIDDISKIVPGHIYQAFQNEHDLENTKDAYLHQFVLCCTKEGESGLLNNSDVGQLDNNDRCHDSHNKDNNSAGGVCHVRPTCKSLMAGITHGYVSDSSDRRSESSVRSTGNSAAQLFSVYVEEVANGVCQNVETINVNTYKKVAQRVKPVATTLPENTYPGP